MNYKTSKLRDAVLLALVAGSFSGVAMAQTANTQPATTTQETGKQLDQIVVTGTRIKSQTMTASSPVAEVGQEQFQNSGATRADDLINQMPQMAPYFDNFANNGAQGYPTADLRGLGSNRTLTLVNGNRLAPGPAGSGVVDISIVPAAIIKRVDILTGGASAVYGADAVAGVVNFVLNDDFEGVSLNAGVSGYQHNNRNKYLTGLMDAAKYKYPTGNSGFDGQSRNIDIAIGGSFADGKGHAMAWLGWRKNDPLYQSQRDYSSCATTAAGTACGGSGTAPNPNFLVYDATNPKEPSLISKAHIDPATGKYVPGYSVPYNYAPVNYYQRPDTRYTFGAAAKYTINDHFEPFAEVMYVSKKSRTQIAESGTFFAQSYYTTCADPLIGNLCSDLGAPKVPLNIMVGKRNVEGGPRTFDDDTTQFRILTGVRGQIGSSSWSYEASYLLGQTENSNVSLNDFLSDRVLQALRGCPSGSFTGCVPYNVWQYNGVTPAAAKALQGTGIIKYSTQLQVLNGFVSGDLGWGLPSAGNDPVKVVAGYEWRKNTIERTPDSNSEAGNFTGSGGPKTFLRGSTSVRDLFGEVAVPLIKDAGFVKSLNLDLGYRLSHYDLSGSASTWKIGANFDMGMVRLRGGYNSAIRAPSIGELFATQQIALTGTSDGCAGDKPEFTREQCKRTGVTDALYGQILPSPADQYNGFIGGTPTLTPEKAKTWTIGAAISPIKGLDLSIDYYDIKMKDRISTLGFDYVLNTCANTNDPTLCGLIHRRPGTGDLWVGSDPASSGLITDLTANRGLSHNRGVDLTASYRWDMLGGRANVSFVGSRDLQSWRKPVPTLAASAYDCAGKINTSCMNPRWRHIANVGFSKDWYKVNLRWRYMGQMDYVNIDGSKGSVDKLLVSYGGKLAAQNYFDLSATLSVGPADWTFGVNNIADREPVLTGNTITTAWGNGNSISAYDQAGRYFFTTLSFKW